MEEVSLIHWERSAEQNQAVGEILTKTPEISGVARPVYGAVVPASEAS